MPPTGRAGHTIGLLLLVVALLSSTVPAILPYNVAKADPQPLGEIIALRTENSKTFSLGNNRYSVQTSLGSIHYKDAGNLWQDIETATSEADSGNFSARFTKLPYLVRIGDDSYRRIYPDRNDLSYWVDIGKPFQMGTPTKSGNIWTWDFANASASISFGRKTVKFDAVLKNAQAPSSLTFPFAVQGITRTGGHLYHDGKEVARLEAPYATDANGLARDLDVVWGTGQITVTIDPTGMVYPITIDPSVSVSIAASSDDIRVHWDGAAWQRSLVVNNDLVGYAAAGYQKVGGGSRFLAVNIPAGATITSANITGTAMASNLGNTVNSVFYGELNANAATFSTVADYQARRGTVVGGADDTQITTTNVTWDSIPAWTVNITYGSPDLSPIIQEMVNTLGALTDIVIFFDDHAARGTQVGTAIRQWASWDNVTYPPPTLYVEYTTGAAAPTVVTNPVEAVAATSANMSGNITATGGENPSTRGFEWGTISGGYTANWTEAGSFGISYFSHNQTALQKGTTYYFRALAVNSANVSYGAEESFTTLKTVPSVTNGVGATNITNTSARLNGEITDAGGENPTTYAYWGTVDGTDNVSAWSNNTTIGVTALGTFLYDTPADNLTAGTLYYYRMKAANSMGTVWASPSDNFTTLTLLLAPTSFVLSDLGGVTLGGSWVPGVGASYTMVRVSRDHYPTSPTDGELFYYGSLSSANMTGWDLDLLTAYGSAWGFAADNITYSTTYATDSVGGAAMILLAFIVLAVALTVAMFATKQSMLGFPCFIFWALLCGYAYTISTATWDLYYLLFFASIGMAIFCSLAAFALRTEKEERQAGEEYIDEGRSGSQFMDEGKSRNAGNDSATPQPSNSDQPSRRVRVVRERAERRREQGVAHRTGCGEFK